MCGLWDVFSTSSAPCDTRYFPSLHSPCTTGLTVGLSPNIVNESLYKIPLLHSKLLQNLYCEIMEAQYHQPHSVCVSGDLHTSLLALMFSSRRPAGRA